MHDAFQTELTTTSPDILTARKAAMLTSTKAALQRLSSVRLAHHVAAVQHGIGFEDAGKHKEAERLGRLAIAMALLRRRSDQVFTEG